MIPLDVDEYYKTRGTTDANLMGWGVKVTANGHTAFLASDLMSTESDWETPNGFEDRIADDDIEYDGVQNSEWGQEYESETPRAWWFKAGRPAATTGWWEGPSGDRYYFNDSASAVAEQWLDIDGVSYHFDATGALIEYKASGTVIAVSGSSTPSPTRWAIGGGVLVLLAGGAVLLRRRR